MRLPALRPRRPRPPLAELDRLMADIGCAFAVGVIVGIGITLLFILAR